MEMNSRSVFNEIIDTIETTPLTIWSATTTLIHNSHPHQQTPQTLNPLIIVLVVIRRHLLILQLHLLHQSLQIRVLLLVRHTRLRLTHTLLTHLILHRHRAAILLQHTLQLANRLVQQLHALSLLQRHRRHHVQWRRDQTDLPLTPTHLPHRNRHVLRAHRLRRLLHRHASLARPPLPHAVHPRPGC